MTLQTLQCGVQTNVFFCALRRFRDEAAFDFDEQESRGSGSGAGGMRDYGADDFDDDDLNVACTEDEADEPPPTGKTQSYPFCLFLQKYNDSPGEDKSLTHQQHAFQWGRKQ